MTMNEEKINTLTECLFSLVNSFNSVVDRLDTLAEKQEELIKNNDSVFTKMREEFWRRVIQIEVDKNIK